MRAHHEAAWSRGSVGHGPIGELFQGAVRRAEKVVEDVTEAVARAYEDSAKGLRRVAQRTIEDDARAKSAFDGLGRRPPSETPGSPIATPPHEPAGGGGRPRILRQDDDFSAPTNERGVPKSQLADDGSIVPADPNGRTTPLQHVLGASPAKGESPYTSFFTEGSTVKRYGSNEVELDMERLRADIGSGRLPGVEVVPPAQVQADIRGDIRRIAPIDVDRALANGPRGIDGYLDSVEGLSRGKRLRLERRLVSLFNTTRAQEYLVKGVIPPGYLIGPYPTP